jgi:hypothetical protein
MFMYTSDSKRTISYYPYRKEKWCLNCPFYHCSCLPQSLEFAVRGCILQKIYQYMVDGPGLGIIINDGILADYLKKINIIVSQNEVHTCFRIISTLSLS